MKRATRVLLSCAALLLCLPMRALAAINFDGSVDNGEWFAYPAALLFPPYSQCGITSATVRFAVQPEKSQVMFGFTAVAPDAAQDSPVGAAFLLGAREIGRWQHGLGGTFDAANYDLRGLARIPPDSANGGFTFEIALGYKTEAALLALRDLSVQLFDPQGVPSRPVACPVAAAEPVTTAKAATTEKTTTTKAPATEKTTTTKTATTLPAYTTAPPAYAPAQQAANQAPATAPNATAQAGQAQTSRTETYWYTVVYTDAPGGMDAAEQQTIWTHSPLITDAAQAQTLPTLAVPAPQASRPASRSTPLLYAAVGLLVLLAGVLIAFWLRGQRAAEQEKPEEPT